MTTPSVLLSEGFCPVEHGPLHQYKGWGWCFVCGLYFKLRIGVFATEQYVDMTINPSDDENRYACSLISIDHRTELNALLESIYRNLSTAYDERR